jgi:putative DNA primase/helicase
LWAQAFAAWKVGDIWWIDGPEEQELCEAEQETRLSRDAWEDIISDWLAGKTSPYFTAAQILQDALSIDPAHIQRVHQNRLSPIMKALGWGKGRRDIGGKRVNVYTRPEADLAQQAEPNEVPW